MTALKLLGIFVLCLIPAVALAVGLTFALGLDGGAAFVVGLLCGAPAGPASVYIASERGLL